ncbi:hypothetical protein COCMIDRAFT_35209 [Bipolaris oryzae ATCC 44560]|uniref:Uncharacterized protein n=1 Tax=Bipolaris oryzae ATCC 44560 TaxID=930090 RepID=W6ZU51_COCMI|nr:uncharacterized protein COCMIDRAFT_35209 [Bipolaris oryzae ATCC 44560]EUC47211.1 hypothetical protein COCMIDRAFT_35209 [Bipolaris oryzae ATCC 44560]
MPLFCIGGILGCHKSTYVCRSEIADVLFGPNLMSQQALSSGFSVPAPRTTLERLQMAKCCFGLYSGPNITAEQKLCRDPS